MSKIRDISERVYFRLHNANGVQQVFIDPASIMLIMTLVSGVIQAIKKCKEKPEEAVKVASNPSDREKKILKRHIRKELGWRKYYKEGDDYFYSVLEEGKFLTEKDFKDSYKETSEYKIN